MKATDSEHTTVQNTTKTNNIVHTKNMRPSDAAEKRAICLA
eukprot:jgi/Antlo1/366/1397